MRIVVCAKEVLDPDAVSSYALAGKLTVGEDGRSFTQAAIPRLLNAYDEQAIEAALRLRDAGAQCRISVVSIGTDATSILIHAAALGADDIASIPIDPAGLDARGVARLLAAYVRTTGGADLVLCGRQASDDDQGVVPALVATLLGMPLVTVARAVDLQSDGKLQVVRVTPDGDETVAGPCPALVTISSELGQPRYPSVAARMKARKMRPTAFPLEALSLNAEDLAPRVKLVRQFVPVVQGRCERIEAGTPAEAADRLVARLREEGVL